MKLIVGLGNPGSAYEQSRHNLGFIAVERFAELIQAEPFHLKAAFHAKLADARSSTSGRLVLVKPQTYMNDSGHAVQHLAAYYDVNPEDVWVFHDELDLPKGTIRASFDSRSAGHNGVQSIIDALGSKEFHRVRIGIGPLPERVPADSYVLARMDADEQAQHRTALDHFLPSLAGGGLT